ncbi:phytoene desaturase family protein [Gordonia soli]|uniref:Pyridine nucleotide-disulfide oxidoreductase domain-containing protein 2 n=1 Tax=Gordonia soli NBRC 108243 TaxID=1223545 RepID=M0QRH0_9ACTN|nr:NAD(P)/FAD-dependent oxidoreductase [Gordonia soli]GAC70921.1 putative oxidoreductase [Gordonia soli NBRC 108243]
MRYDDVIIGAGHNGLTAAAYLARAGRSVLVLEATDHVGGATVSATPFPGMPARLSRYSYLVSLMPRELIADLELDIELVRRRYSSYTPVPENPTVGLLIDNADADRTADSFRRVTGSDTAATEWQRFYEQMATVATRLFPTMTEPLRSAEDVADLVVGDDTDLAALWDQLTTRPLGELIEARFDDDLVRGVVATDALIGTFADLHDDSLRQNICFLYHLIGGGTGDWDVPVGGMGAVSGALYEAARAAGAEVRTGAAVRHVEPSDGTIELDGETITSDMISAACAPAVLDALLDEPLTTEPRAHGAQLKINLLLDRLPRLIDRATPVDAAFAGTFHINESYRQLRTAWQQAARGDVPDTPPCEIYCHTVSDRSILGPELAGMHTLTLFGLHMTPSVLRSDESVDHAVAATLDSLDSVLAEPIRSVIADDANADPCIEVKTPHDLEAALSMPGGNIFHRPLQWPWAQSPDEVGTFGVETRHPKLLLCGAGARRGGGVSGIPGRNAARRILGE